MLEIVRITINSNNPAMTECYIVSKDLLPGRIKAQENLYSICYHLV